MATETLPLSAVRPRLSELVERADAEFDRFIITRRGRPEAMLLSAEEFEGLEETLEILADRALVKRLSEASEELAGGGGRVLSEVRAKPRARRPAVHRR